LKSLKAGIPILLVFLVTCSFVYGQKIPLMKKNTINEYNFYIPHIPDSPWNTQITVQNDKEMDLIVSFNKWDALGVLTHENIEYTLKSFSSLTIKFPDDYEGSGIALVKCSSADIRVKLSYQYENSESLCEFFISPNNKGKKWLIPNSIHDWFSWFGVGISNFSETSTVFNLKAFKGNEIVGEVSIPVNAFSKNVQLCNGFFAGLNYKDIDSILVESDQDIVFPLSITGDEAQSRHVFFQAKPIPIYNDTNNKTYYIPHIPDLSWGTTFTAFNLENTSSTFTLNQWDDSGVQIITNKEFTIPSNSFLEIKSGSDFNVDGIGTLTTHNNLIFKMSYRQGNSKSLCEFFLSQNLATKWTINNSITDWFHWFGLGIANFSSETINVTLNAYKNGTLIESVTKEISALRKLVNISTSIWESIDSYDDIDTVTIETSKPVPTPLSISGNNNQDRHTFFLGEIITNNDHQEEWVSHVKNVWNCCEAKLELKYSGDTYESFWSTYYDKAWHLIGGMRGSYEINNRFIKHTLREVYYIVEEGSSEFGWFGSDTQQYKLLEYVFMYQENFETLEYALTNEGMVLKTDKNRDGSYDNHTEIIHCIKKNKDNFQPGNYGFFPFINYAAVKFFSFPENVNLSVEVDSSMSGAVITSAQVTLSGPNGITKKDIQLAKAPSNNDWEVKNYSMGGYPVSGLWWLSKITVTMDDGSSATYTQNDPHNNCYLLSYVSSNGHTEENYPQHNGQIEAQDYVCDLNSGNDLFYIETIAINSSEYSDPVIKVYHESDTKKWVAFNDDGGRGGYNSGVIIPLVSGETYYIKIQDLFFRGDSYSILINKNGFTGTATELADFPDQYEFDDNYLFATPLYLDVIQNHTLPRGDNDWFIFVAP